METRTLQIADEIVSTSYRFQRHMVERIILLSRLHGNDVKENVASLSESLGAIERETVSLHKKCEECKSFPDMICEIPSLIMFLNAEFWGFVLENAAMKKNVFFINGETTDPSGPPEDFSVSAKEFCKYLRKGTDP